MLLSDPPSPVPDSGDKSFFRGSRGSPQAMSPPLVQEVGVTGDRDKHVIEMKIIKDSTENKNNAKDLRSNVNLNGNQEVSTDTEKTIANVDYSESSGVINREGEGANSHVQDFVGGKQELEIKETECHLNGSKDEIHNPDSDVSDVKHGRDSEDKDASIYRTTSVVKIQKETTV